MFRGISIIIWVVLTATYFIWPNKRVDCPTFMCFSIVPYVPAMALIAGFIILLFVPYLLSNYMKKIAIILMVAILACFGSALLLRWHDKAIASDAHSSPATIERIIGRAKEKDFSGIAPLARNPSLTPEKIEVIYNIIAPYSEEETEVMQAIAEHPNTPSNVLIWIYVLYQPGWEKILPRVSCGWIDKLEAESRHYSLPGKHLDDVVKIKQQKCTQARSRH